MTRKRVFRSLLFPCKTHTAILAGLFLAGCGSTEGRDAQHSASTATVAEKAKAQVPVFGAKVVKTFPHDPQAFTQGLEYYGGYLYESTGRTGESTLRKVALETGQVIKKVSLPAQEFGEGLTIFHGKIYQLTWLSKKGFIYSLDGFRHVGEFHYESEGWGLTHDETSLILSDGTNTLRFIDPVSFAVTKTIEVYSGDVAVTNLNELEYIDGEIFSNVWHSSRIARIDSHSGKVLAWIDLTPLVAKEQHGEEDVLNGIAYDHEAHRLFVTGKDWPEILQIKLESEPRQ
jgi:glutaminyl-peptide cyclotransferase